MKVLVLGGTGSIGCAVVRVLQERNHEVLALCRSAEACELLRKTGATPIEGDLRDPVQWIDIVKDVDGIVHAAAAWGEDMEAIDRRATEALLETLQHGPSSKAFIYTGGCWLYGETGDVVATEQSPLNPIASFTWSIPIMQMVLSASYIRGMVIHPAMVYERNGGVFEHIFEDAKRLGITADPVVCDVASAVTEIGAWAEGYALDQQMSGQKAIEQLGWRPKHVDVIADIA